MNLPIGLDTLPIPQLHAAGHDFEAQLGTPGLSVLAR